MKKILKLCRGTYKAVYEYGKTILGREGLTAGKCEDKTDLPIFKRILLPWN